MNPVKTAAAWLLAAAFVMLALPWAAVTLVNGDAGMAVCFLLFFAVDPLFSLVLGAAAGRHLKKLWFLPAAPPLLFLAGVWIFFEPRESAFWLYAGAYLLLGAAAMLIAAAVTGKKVPAEQNPSVRR